VKAIWRGFTLILIAAVIVLLVVGLVLPSSRSVEKSVTVNATPEAVFDVVNDFNSFQDWSSWASANPGPRLELRGRFEGKGAVVRWQEGPPLAEAGELEIVDTDPPREVRIAARFEGVEEASYTFTIEPAGDAARLTWHYESEFGWDLVGRYLGWFRQSWAEKDANQSLAAIKALAEDGAGQ